VTGRCHLHNRNPGARPRVEGGTPARVHTVILVLILLAITASARIASPADGAAPPAPGVRRRTRHRPGSPHRTMFRCVWRSRGASCRQDRRCAAPSRSPASGPDPIGRGRLGGPSERRSRGRGPRSRGVARRGVSHRAVGPPARAGQPRRSGPQGGGEDGGRLRGRGQFSLLVYPGETGGRWPTCSARRASRSTIPRAGRAPVLAALGLRLENSPCSKVWRSTGET